MNKEILKLENVSKSYQSEAEEIKVLSNIDFSLNEAESVSVVGPSGVGKSTLLNVMGGLDRPDEGAVYFSGEDISSKSKEELSRFRNKEVSFVFQDAHLLPQLTLLENVLLPVLAEHDEAKEKIPRAESLLKECGLYNRINHNPFELSGGEKQRAALIRAFIMSPRLILLDEPTGSLDEKSSDALLELMLRLKEKEKIALVCVTHSKSLASKMQFSYEIKEGALIKS